MTFTESIPYVIGFITIAASIYASRRSSNSSEQKTETERAMEQTKRIDRLERNVSYLRKRDLWNQECQYRLTGAMEHAGIPIPALPPEPEPEPDLMS